MTITYTEAVYKRALTLLTDEYDHGGNAALFGIACGLRHKDEFKAAPRNIVRLAVLRARDEVCEKRLGFINGRAAAPTALADTEWNKITDELMEELEVK